MKKILLIFALIIAGVYLTTNTKTPIILEQNTTILAFGDSLTYGIGADKNESYPEVLSTLLGVTVISSGVPGEVSQDGLARLPSVLEKTNPNILILCHGGNDILKKYSLSLTKQNLKTMIEMAQMKNIRVVLVGVPVWSGFLGIKTAKIYDELVDELDIDYEGDVLEDIISDIDLKADRVHPNNKGYQKIAQALAKVILQE